MASNGPVLESVPALIERFIKEFEPLYGVNDARWQGLKRIGSILLNQNRPVHIVETGSLRRPGGWRSDGCTTAVWDWIVREAGGSCLTFDIEPSAILTTMWACPNVQPHCSDSIIALRGPLPKHIDLLFLDSYDYSPGQEINAAFHQLGELGAAWHALPEDCLIASDDCKGAEGKHLLSRQVFTVLGIKPLYEGYITIWQKKTPVVEGQK